MNKIPMSPRARAFAEKNNIDISGLQPSGKDGNIRYFRYDDVSNIRITPLAEKIAKDMNVDISRMDTDVKIRKSHILQASAEGGQAGISRLGKAREALYENLRKSVAETIPYTLFAKADITNAYEKYSSLKKTSLADITLTDIILYATAGALKRNIILNTTRENGFYIENTDVNISLAVDRDGNIITPVFRNADMMDIGDMTRMRTEILRRAASSKITPDELRGGTFTVSNLGRGTVGHFTPVINYPQSAILGVGMTEDELYLQDGELRVRKIIYLSLTADHTIIDGKAASAFLSDIQTILSEVR